MTDIQCMRPCGGGADGWPLDPPPAAAAPAPPGAPPLAVVTAAAAAAGATVEPDDTAGAWPGAAEVGGVADDTPPAADADDEGLPLDSPRWPPDGTT